MAHFTCVGATVPELRGTLDEMAAVGIENVLALRGDPPAGEDAWIKTEGGLEYSSELVALAGADYPFAIGAACFPETHIHASSPTADLEHLAEKVRAGADFLITQLFFDNALYFDFVARARAVGIEVPIVPGIMPITQVGQIERMAAMCGASIPEGLRRELHLREDAPEAVLDFGVAYAPPCTVRRAARRRRPRRPLLHPQPLARDARDPERAEAGAAVGGLRA